MVIRHALVFQTTLDLHQIVIQNAQLTKIVQAIRHAFAISVSIHAQAHVASMQNVVLSIIHRYALA